ncbi:acetyl-CoA carboxylase biotin carboxyl carrier protein [Thermoactinomyces sp. CICC 10523]|uniref:acetyl-CoA carboxylase biotin carboxyl carrier protein n=1 Tax=Thermoactinomyces sp. CICC 10523 TaxID=2767428 RepID=UPI0018DC7FC1|nr:acetyl-CoA carboxylase biotin carboxyl carrier protein [Thermoactinomyces sp. CICC 10523]MBH8596748.1 acetyl-CoA carboxylase biotin carboxyl carrier protein [Thermoactinomyces sp. CICC 10523]
MAFKMHEIRELIRLIDESQIEEFELDNEGAKVIIKKATGRAEATLPQPGIAGEAKPAAVPAAAVKPVETQAASVAAEAPAEPKKPADELDDANLHKIVSPMVGTFYRAPSPDADPYVKEGDEIQENTVVCIVEAMKLMNEIEAEVRGTVVKVLVENGQLVEYGQPLFLVKRS